MSQLLLPGAGKTEVGILPASDFCQRWTHRRHSWRHTSEGGFNSRAFEVAEIAQGDAVAFCEAHHYGGKPGGLLDQYGLYQGEQLVGVAVLTNGGFPAVLRAAFPHLEPYAESRELGRLVLLDRVPANAESWFLAEAFRRQAARGTRGIVSFSDPVARVDPDTGAQTMPGHVGTIYQASNATYTGRITPRTVWFHQGRLINEQLLGKARNPGKEGHDYAVGQLLAWGATPRTRRQDPKVWLHQALRETGCYSQRHHGNHRYQFALGDRRQRRSVVLGGAAQSYPKKDLAA